jgi:hypothetical protein
MYSNYDRMFDVPISPPEYLQTATNTKKISYLVKGKKLRISPLAFMLIKT